MRNLGQELKKKMQENNKGKSIRQNPVTYSVKSLNKAKTIRKHKLE